MIQSNIDLRPYNTFGVSVTARYFVDIQTPDQFSKLMQDPIFQNTANKLFLGGGSNLLLTQDFDGLVIHNSIDTMRIISLDGDTMKVMVGGGVIRHDFVMRAAERSRRGAENLALIPGTVGAAPVQNIGAYGVEVKDVITSVKGFDLTTRDIRALNPIECHFGYRDSVFKHELKDKFFITHVTFQLSKNPSPRLEYKGLEDLQSKAGLTPMDVAQRVIEVRQSKLPDRHEIGTAGSFFRNPTISQSEYEKLLGEYGDLVGREIHDGPNGLNGGKRPNSYKLSAAQLIELAGYPRGTRVGDAGNYDHHALVLVNHGSATGAEVWSFAQDIIRAVKEKFGVVLEAEVNVV